MYLSDQIQDAFLVHDSTPRSLNASKVFIEYEYTNGPCVNRVIPYHPPPSGVVSKLDCSTTKRVPIPNETSSGSSRRGVSDADLSGTDTIPTVDLSKSVQVCV